MHSRWIACHLLAAAVVLVSFSDGAADRKDPAKDKARPARVQVTVDTSEAPALASWAKKAKKLVEEWHPRIAKLLESDRFTPPRVVKLVFTKEMKGVAFASGTTITIAAQWIDKHPDDYGMVVHELTHVVQAYRRARGAGWLVEGIADYVRFFHYEPNVKVNIPNPRRASYRDSYRTSAKFLAWIEKNHDKNIVRKLNAALRASTYKDELFKTYTAKSLDELWAAFVAALEKQRT